MNEHISREAVVKIMDNSERPENDRMDIGYNEALDDMKQRLTEIPATDVQPVIQSRWIPMGDGTYNAYCENCGQERGSKSWNKNDFKYCFGCGARMDLDGDVK